MKKLIIFLLFSVILNQLTANGITPGVTANFIYYTEYKAFNFNPAFSIDYKRHSIHLGPEYNFFNHGKMMFEYNPENTKERIGANIGYRFFIRDPEKIWSYGLQYFLHYNYTRFQVPGGLFHDFENASVLTHSFGIALLYNFKPELNLILGWGLVNNSYVYWENGDKNLVNNSTLQLGLRYRFMD